MAGPEIFKPQFCYLNKQSSLYVPTPPISVDELPD